MANRLAQGCPAIADLLNILYEPFHRWAASHGVGVPVLDTHVASGSFADDVALLGTSLQELSFLVIGYQCWCALLGIKINLGKLSSGLYLPALTFYCLLVYLFRVNSVRSDIKMM